jgi:hypothetical protein
MKYVGRPKIMACIAVFGLPVLWAPRVSPQDVAIQDLAREGAAWISKPAVLNAKRQSLLEMLRLVIPSQGAGFVIDGDPVMRTADLQINGSAGEVLDRIADLFDYSWSATPEGIVVLNKRFKTSDDRPQVKVPEMLAMARDVTRAFDAMSFDRSNRWEVPLLSLANSLSVDQLNALKAGRVLKGASLTAHQLELLQSALLTNTFATSAEAWYEFRTQLAGIGESVVSLEGGGIPLREGSQSQTRTLIYSVKLKSGGTLATPLFPSLARPSEFRGIRPAPGGSPSQFLSDESRGPDSPVSPPQGNTNKNSPRSVMIAKVSLSNESIQAGRVIDLVAEKTGCHIDIPESLRIRVMSVHVNDMRAVSVLNAIAQLNDWKYTIRENDSVLISRYGFALPAHPKDLQIAVIAAMPKDLRFYILCPIAFVGPSPIKANQNGRAPAGGQYPFAVNQQRGQESLRLQSKALYDSLGTSLPVGGSMAFGRFDSVLCDRLLLCLALRAISRTRYDLLHADSPLPTYIIDPRAAELELGAEDTLMIYSWSVQDGIEHRKGFGGLRLVR